MGVLEKKDIENFIELYEEKFGVKLDFGEAKILAHQVLVITKNTLSHNLLKHE